MHITSLVPVQIASGSQTRAKYSFFHILDDGEKRVKPNV